MVHDRDIHRTVVVVIGDGEPAGGMRLPERTVSGREIVEEIAADGRSGLILS